MIAILCPGTRGDVQPYIALGVALQQAGCPVRLATHENFAGFVRSHGLDFFPVRGDVTQIAAGADGQQALQADNPLKILLAFRKLQALAFDLQTDFYAACQGAQAVVYHPGPSIGYFIARQMGVPAVLASPYPLTPTRDYPSLLFYHLPRLGGVYNRLTHHLLAKIFWTAARGPAGAFWKRTFGQLPENFTSPFPRQVTRTHPTVIGCSPSVFALPADAPPNVHHTGYWFLEEEEPGWSPPERLLAFLEQGPPPVYVGFGSMSDPKSAQATTQTVIEALRQAGQRGVLATGWNGLAQAEVDPAQIHILESAPHSWLFPRMAAAVHHGGAGTTAAGLRAGIPAVIIPHHSDQFAWGLRVYELGAGARPLPKKQLNAERLAAGINQALAEPVKAAASRLGEQIRSENGAQSAARIILQTLR